jgi:hypothetical protein
MPPGAQAAPQGAAAAAALPLDVLARICSFLPDGDLVFTAPRLGKALAAALEPRIESIREKMERVYSSNTYHTPLWALQEAKPRLNSGQQWKAVGRAAFHGDTATLRWAHGMGLILDGEADVYGEATRGCQLEALQCALELGYPLRRLYTSFCTGAAQAGHLAVLQWVRAQEPPCHWRVSTCRAAAEAGHLAVLQWARAQEPPCPWDASTCAAAAAGGHLAVLQWARAQDPPCPWDASTCEAAAAGGHLAVLQWARAQVPPCPWDTETYQAAAKGGHLAVLQWTQAQEPPRPCVVELDSPTYGYA